MSRVNNKGVAAGYLATTGAFGPSLPTTCTGNGRFQPFGIQSLLCNAAVTALNDHGDAVGSLDGSSPAASATSSSPGSPSPA